MKKIAIDCRNIDLKYGIGRYIRNILSYLLSNNTHYEYYLLTDKPFRTHVKLNNSKIIILSGNSLIYKFIKTPLFLKKENIDIYWSPTQELPLFKPITCKYICTVHDIAFEYHKNWFDWKVKLLSYLNIYEKSVKIADCVLADSNFTKKDVIKTYKIKQSKIICTYIGIDEVFKKIDKSVAKKYLKSKFNINFPYILYIDTVRSRNLITAFADLINSEWKNNNIKLICLGKFSDREQHPDKVATELNIKNRVVIIDRHISDFELNHLYSGAEFFVSPSFYEGFGLTPLEALKCGTPVLISKNTSHYEIFKDTALYCNPHNIRDIRNKIILMIKEGVRKKIVSENDNLIKKYNWNIVSNVISNIFCQI